MKFVAVRELLIRGAAFGVAMGNADPAVKEAADWVTGSNREGGLALLIDRLVEDGTADGSG